MNLYIKYMVSLRCKLVVKQELQNLGINYVAIELGMVELKEDLNPQLREQLKNTLQKSGLELMDDKRSKMVEEASNLIIQMIQYSDELPRESYSDHISSKLNCNYVQLSSLFAEVKGINIQNFIIANKIERVKELLIYDNLNLTDISYQLQYSSVAHLSNQFKRITGLTPSFFKKLNARRKKNMQGVGIM